MKNIILDEEDFKKFIKQQHLSVDNGVIHFTNWYDEIIFDTKFGTWRECCEIYVNNKKIDIQPIVYLLHVWKRCILSVDDFKRSKGIHRRMESILDELIEAAILKTR